MQWTFKVTNTKKKKGKIVISGNMGNFKLH